MLQFAGVSDINNRSTCKIAYDGARERRITKGVNIEIKCKCTPAYTVIHRYGFGIFDVSDMLPSCPNCDTYGTPLTTGLWECYYRIFRVKQDGTRYKCAWI